MYYIGNNGYDFKVGLALANQYNCTLPGFGRFILKLESAMPYKNKAI